MKGYENHFQWMTPVSSCAALFWNGPYTFVIERLRWYKFSHIIRKTLVSNVCVKIVRKRKRKTRCEYACRLSICSMLTWMYESYHVEAQPAQKIAAFSGFSGAAWMMVSSNRHDSRPWKKRVPSAKSKKSLSVLLYSSHGKIMFAFKEYSGTIIFDNSTTWIISAWSLSVHFLSVSHIYSR